MINEEYSEKTQILKAKMQELISEEYKYIDSRANYINTLIDGLKDSNNLMTELLNLKKDNEDLRALLFSFENMLKNRFTADGISRFHELLQGCINFSNEIDAGLEKFSSV